MKKITINNQEYNIKASFRAMMEVEKMTGKAFSLKPTTTDLMNYSYAILKSCNEDFMTFDEFIDACDETPNIFVLMTKFITEEWYGTEAAEGEAVEQKKR